MLMIISRKNIGFYYQKVKIHAGRRKIDPKCIKKRSKTSNFFDNGAVGTAGKYFKI